MKYPFGLEVWNIFGIELPPTGNLSFNAWFLTLIDLLEPNVLCLSLTLVWALWFNRHRARLEEETQTPVQIVDLPTSYLDQFRASRILKILLAYLYNVSSFD
ncbi:unnamed protein product [Ilex paraguariensis]|uniref:Uncharacterized protein n=1 Tax=Ilex paraguariensis TaxID=185542 RepID=A0ABC8TTN5_9AQUA